MHFELTVSQLDKIGNCKFQFSSSNILGSTVTQGCLTRDRLVAGSSLAGVNVLCP